MARVTGEMQNYRCRISHASNSYQWGYWDGFEGTNHPLHPHEAIIVSSERCRDSPVLSTKCCPAKLSILLLFETCLNYIIACTFNLVMSITIIIIEYMPMEAQEKVHYGIMIKWYMKHNYLDSASLTYNKLKFTTSKPGTKQWSLLISLIKYAIAVWPKVWL